MDEKEKNYNIGLLVVLFLLGALLGWLVIIAGAALAVVVGPVVFVALIVGFVVFFVWLLAKIFGAK